MLCACAANKANEGVKSDRGPLGTERADCRPVAGGGAGGAVGACDVGLLCLSNVCVRPPPADCNLVAETLASNDLGNYAPVETRKPLVAKYSAECEKARVSKEEGECLLKAGSKWAAARCVPRLFPEQKSGGSADCEAIAARIMQLMDKELASMSEDMQKMMSKVTSVMTASCHEDEWPAPFKQCILESSGADALNECDTHMPPGLEKRIQERMEQVLR